MDKKTVLSEADIFGTKDIRSVEKWVKRKTVKVLLRNQKNKIALITNSIHGFYLLPGGGINENEDIFVAAASESP